MSGDRDLALALQLQAQFDEEAAAEISRASASRSEEDSNGGTPGRGGPGGRGCGGDGGRSVSGPVKPMSIVDEKWELLDPNPDMRAMFLEFNDKYFWGRLAGVEVRWSPRMTLCAGLCCYEGRGGLCSIRLSSPLLKLRPRKDLVETLLHEMIHAYLFVTANNKDHDGHGPEFCKHMKRLNQSTGTNITIYHNFHDEVDVYRQHWWRCNGPCQKRPPYYGMVRRAMNRAPSPRDPWWAEHQRTCGGLYTKVKEPEGYGVKKGTKRKKGESEEDSSENEAKKQATDVPTLFPGKGITLGGTGTVSRLVQPKAATLDKFLRKIEGSKPPASSSTPPPLPVPVPSTSRVPSIREEAEPGQSQRDTSRNSRLKALAAIFDSDDEDDADIVIVKFDNPLEKNTGRQGAADDDDIHEIMMPGTSQSSSQHPAKDAGSHSRRTSPPAGPASTSTPSQIGNGNPSKGSGSSASHHTSNREDHGKRQDSIIDAFSRMRQRSGEQKQGDPRMGNVENQRSRAQDKNISQSSRRDGSFSGAINVDKELALDAGTVECPVCTLKVDQSQINRHLDQCLS